ncbi:MAG: LysM peptidoglycan-binding domain-containing protein [Clostridia bacterium]|nr:LysM peptidoglycan-binding domain-containing protein [Clostridia bacterium]
MAQKTRTMVLRRGDEDESQRLVLPVNPRDVVISRPQNTLSYVTVRGETVSAAGGSGLTQVSLETFLPAESSPFYGGSSPAEALAMLRQWEREGVPVRLMISGTELDDLFLIVGLRQKLREGDEDVGIGIDLKEYKFITLAETDVLGGETAGGLYQRADERSTPAVYVTEEGDDLWTVARRYLGDGSRWKELAEKNGIGDPHELPAGKEIYLA